MKNKILLAAFWFLVFASSRAAEPEELGLLKEKLGRLPKEGWVLSGGGGYVFTFDLDVDGDDKPERFFNSSLESQSWEIFGGSEQDEHWGTLNHPVYEMLIQSNDNGLSVFSSFTSHDWVNHILEQRITPNGVIVKDKKVGVDATKEEYDAIASGLSLPETPEGFIKLSPVIKYKKLKDYLADPYSEWLEFMHEEWTLEDGYYIHQKDSDEVFAMKMSWADDIIDEVTRGFTLEAAHRAVDLLLDQEPLSLLGTEQNPAVRETGEERGEAQEQNSETASRQSKEVSSPKFFKIRYGIAALATAIAAWFIIYRRSSSS